MVKILICDDEQLWIDNLKKAILNVCSTEIDLHTFTTGDSLLNYLSSNNADIIFMDIMLPISTGIDFAKEISKYYKHIQIIFTSISKDYIQDVFSVRPAYYLVKPFEDKNVDEALSIAFENLDCQKHTISVVSKGKTTNILVTDIEYIESDKRVVNFYTDSDIIQSVMKLDDVEHLLPNNFVRCHQSYLVNINSISKIANNEIVTYSDVRIPVAKSRYSITKKTIINYWENQI